MDRFEGLVELELTEREKAAKESFARQTKIINDELAAAGAVPSTVAEYQNKFAGDAATKVFLVHLDDPIEDRVKSVMASSMGSANNEYLFDDFARRFRDEIIIRSDSHYSLYVCSLANALSRMVASKATLMKLHNMVWDRSLGGIRVIFLQNFKKLKDPVGIDILAELAKDPDLNREIRSWRVFWKKRRPEVLDIKPEPQE